LLFCAAPSFVEGEPASEISVEPSGDAPELLPEEPLEVPDVPDPPDVADPLDVADPPDVADPLDVADPPDAADPPDVADPPVVADAPAVPDAPEAPPEAVAPDPDDDPVPVGPPDPSGALDPLELDAPVPHACVPQTRPQRVSETPTATAREKLTTPRALRTFSMSLPSRALYHVGAAMRQATGAKVEHYKLAVLVAGCPSNRRFEPGHSMGIPNSRKSVVDEPAERIPPGR
jgi:hypothetical protein